MTDIIPNPRDRAADVRKPKRWQAQAQDIRYEGKCHSCKRQGLYSYVLPNDGPRGKGEESCGYWCASCGWGNGGSRASLDGGE